MGDRLKEKVAIVIGAGSSGPGWGNGKATAVLFAREGAKVVAVAVDVNLAAAEQTANIIEDEGGVCTPLQADVTDPVMVEKFAADIINRYGRIDVLHNNVGIHRRESMASISVEDWELI